MAGESQTKNLKRRGGNTSLRANLETPSAMKAPSTSGGAGTATSAGDCPGSASTLSITNLYSDILVRLARIEAKQDLLLNELTRPAPNAMLRDLAQRIHMGDRSALREHNRRRRLQVVK